MRSGFCKNRVSVIDAWDGISQIELVEPFGNLLVVATGARSRRTMTRRLEMEDSKYNNSNNYRGFPHLTGARIATSTFIEGTTVVPGPTDDPGAVVVVVPAPRWPLSLTAGAT
jgi:hypothetical protein